MLACLSLSKIKGLGVIRLSQIVLVEDFEGDIGSASVTNQKPVFVDSHCDLSEALVVFLVRAAPLAIVRALGTLAHTTSLTVDVPVVTVGGHLVVVCGAITAPVVANTRLDMFLILS